jgi:hypothetical protein
MASAYLTSELDGGGQLHARPLYPRGRALGTHWVGGWVGPRAGLDTVEKVKSLS